jgi:hypothetical protein
MITLMDFIMFGAIIGGAIGTSIAFYKQSKNHYFIKS